MRATLRALRDARSPRERRLLVAAAAVVAAALYIGLVLTAGSALRPLRADVATLREQAARLDQQAREVGQLRALPPPAPAAADLRALVQSRLADTRLEHGLASLEAPDADHVVIAFGAVGFAEWLAWIEALQALQVRVDSCRIEALPAPGMVSVTATLVRTSSP